MAFDKKNLTQLYIEAATKEYEEKLKAEDDETNSFYHDNPEYESQGLVQREAEERIMFADARKVSRNRKLSFIESTTAALLSECIYKVYKDAMNPKIVNEQGIDTMMRAMISEFVLEDANEILSKMRNKTATLSEMYNLIMNTRKKINESLNDSDVDSYKISTSVKDEFFDKLNDLDTESISNAIRERVQAATEKFMIDNKNDHDKIIAALQLTKDKLDEKKDSSEEVKESYEILSKRYINTKIRNRKKGIFESMVTAVSESALKDPELKKEFVEGAKLNVGKIVNRVETMYTFIETVNTMQLYPVDEQYMQDLLESLRKPTH